MNSLLNLGFYRINREALLPSKAHESDAGLDFYSIEDKTIEAKSFKTVKTGLCWKPEFLNTKNPLKKLLIFILKKYFIIYMKLESRSGLSCNYGIEVGAGVLDFSFTGELIVNLFNHSKKAVVINKGSKICQGILYAIPKFLMTEVDTIPFSTERGEKGFGSSDE